MTIFAAVIAMNSALVGQPGGSAEAIHLPDWWSNELVPAAHLPSPGWSENFESGFEVGPLPQRGWTAVLGPKAQIVDDRFILEGERSLRHLGDDTGVSEFALRSPRLTNTYGRITMGVMRGSFRSTVQLVTRDSELRNFNTRVTLASDGRITVGQLNESKDGFDFVDTGFFWTQFERVDIGIETDPHGALRVFVNDMLAFEGVETSYALLGKAGRIGEFAMWTNNESTGFLDGRGDATTLDDFRFVAIPAPGGWTLALGAGLGCGLRRRRGGFV